MGRSPPFAFGGAVCCAALAFADLGDGVPEGEAAPNCVNLRGAIATKQTQGPKSIGWSHTA